MKQTRHGIETAKKKSLPILKSKTAKAKPARYVDTWLVTYNANPPRGVTAPQISVITAADYLKTNISTMRVSIQNGIPITIPGWLVLAITYSEAEAENQRSAMDQLLKPYTEMSRLR